MKTRGAAHARTPPAAAHAPARVRPHHAAARPHHRRAVHALEWEAGARGALRRARIEQARLRHALARLELTVLASPPRPLSRQPRQPLPSAQRQRRAGIPLQPPALPRGSPEVELLLGPQRGEHVRMLASAPRGQGGGAAHEVRRERAAEAAEEEGAAALRVAEQEEVGEQPAARRPRVNGCELAPPMAARPPALCPARRSWRLRRRLQVSQSAFAGSKKHL